MPPTRICNKGSQLSRRRAKRPPRRRLRGLRQPGPDYDRTLATLRPKPFTVGLGFREAYVDDFEPEAHDQPLDALLNDNGVVWPLPDLPTR